MRKSFVLFLIAVCTILSSQTASAHVLESDGSVGAVLHINPADEPVAGEVSDIYFEIKDKKQKFQAKDCVCKLRITRDRTVIFEQPFDKDGGSSYTFPAQDVYTVSALGTPKEGATFEPFELNYSVRVEKGAVGTANVGTPAGKDAKLWVMALSTAVLAFILFMIRYKILHKVK